MVGQRQEEEVEPAITRQHDSRTYLDFTGLILLRQEQTDIVKSHTQETVTQSRNRGTGADTAPCVSPNSNLEKKHTHRISTMGLGLLHDS